MKKKKKKKQPKRIHDEQLKTMRRADWDALLLNGGKRRFDLESLLNQYAYYIALILVAIVVFLVPFVFVVSWSLPHLDCARQCRAVKWRALKRDKTQATWFSLS